MGFIYFPHGAVQAAWTPKATGTAFEMSPILKPLAPYKQYATVVTGLRNKGGESSDPHGIMAGTWLSLRGPEGSRRQGRSRRHRRSARRARTSGRARRSRRWKSRVRAVVRPAPPAWRAAASVARVAFRTPYQALPMETNPRKVFYGMFGQGDTQDERSQLLDDSGSVLDYVMQSSATCSKRLGAADRSSLNDYLDSVREVERRVQKMAVSAKGLSKLPAAPVGVPEDFTELLDVLFEMIALAFQTDQTRIATLHAGEGSQHAHVQHDWRVGCVPSAVASPERSGEARTPDQDPDVSHRALREVRRSACRA